MLLPPPKGSGFPHPNLLMNKKGKILNAAFSLSGAFVFGGQLGFIASVNPQSVTWFIIVKLSAGILGLLIANIFEKQSIE